MEEITFDFCKSKYEKMLGITPEEANNIANQMLKTQPYLLLYLTSAAESNTLFNDTEVDIMLVLGITLWSIFNEKVPSLKMVSEDDIFKYDEENIQFVSSLASEERLNETELKLNEYMNSYSQPSVLKFVFDELLTGCRESQIRVANVFPIFIYLKTVLDSLISATT